MDDKILLTEMRQDIKEIKAGMTELVKQGAVHNHVLTQHEQRSQELKREGDQRQKLIDIRLAPLEDDLIYRVKRYTWIMGSSGLLAVVSLIIGLIEAYFRFRA